MIAEVDEPLDAWLGRRAGSRAYIVEMVDANGRDIGNNGDRLIEMGGQQALRAARMETVSRPQDADVIVIRGNGAMVEGYSAARRIFAEAWNRFPEKPLVVLPSTYHFPKTSFVSGLEDRRAPVVLFCRERTSFEHLRNDHELPSVCSIGLAHDMAFVLQDSEMVVTDRGVAQKHDLIVERSDVEHPLASPAFWRGEGLSRGPSARSFVAARLPNVTKVGRLVTSGLRRMPRRQSEFERICRADLDDVCQSAGRLPILSVDVSAVSCATFEEFRSAIAHARFVYTTRLHAAIYAGMLGRETVMFEGPYHKSRSVFEHSMLNSYPTVRLRSLSD